MRKLAWSSLSQSRPLQNLAVATRSGCLEAAGRRWTPVRAAAGVSDRWMGKRKRRQETERREESHPHQEAGPWPGMPGLLGGAVFLAVGPFVADETVSPGSACAGVEGRPEDCSLMLLRQRRVGLQAALYIAVAQAPAPSGVPPRVFAYETLQEFPHDPTAFTQGLEFEKRCVAGEAGAQTCVDAFWESTGA